MDTLKRFGGKLVGAVRTRIFAAAALALATVILATAVSVSSHAVTVTDGGESRVVLTMHSDPYKAVESAGMTLSEHDELTVDPEEKTININRAMTVEVRADEQSTLLYLTDGTVATAIERAGLTLSSYDTVSLPSDTLLTDGMVIEVDRVEYKEYTVTERIAFETVTKYTTVLKPGKTQVSQEGQNGERAILYRQTLVNGKVAQTDKVKETITKQPVTRIVLKGASYGTPVSKAPFNIELDGTGQPVKYKKLITGTCTAYTSDRHDSGLWTSTGCRAQVGVVAVNPKVIPYGTKLWITSPNGKIVYGYAIAGDTGGSARANKIVADLFYDTYPECTQFGRRTMNVYILE